MFGSIAMICLIAFFATLFITPRFMGFLRASGIVAIDQQKKARPKLPGSGGLCVAFGLLGGIMGYIALNTFLLKISIDLTLLLAASSTILIIALVGILDDLNIKQTLNTDVTGTEEYRVGLRQWVKPVLTLLGAIPLMVVSAGVSTITLPFIGMVDVGILYPLILVPIAVVCVANVNNMLAGMNGLEAGLGLIASFSVGIYALMSGGIEGAVIALALAASLLAFLCYNWYPARILPGDSLTYLIGATFVTAVIIGNVELFALVVYLPWIVEAILKLRGRFAVSSLGVIQPDGSLKSRYKKIYSLTHVVMATGRFKERSITCILIGVEILICLGAFLIYL